MKKEYLDTYCRGLFFCEGKSKRVNELSNENINRYICKITGIKYIDDSFDAMKNALETYLEQNTLVFANNPKHILSGGDGVGDRALELIVEKFQEPTIVLSPEIDAALYTYCRAVEWYYNEKTRYADEKPNFCVNEIDCFLRELTECDCSFREVCSVYSHDLYTGQFSYDPVPAEELMDATGKIKAELPQLKENLEFKDFRMDASADDIFGTLFG